MSKQVVLYFFNIVCIQINAQKCLTKLKFFNESTSVDGIPVPLRPLVSLSCTSEDFIEYRETNVYKYMLQLLNTKKKQFISRKLNFECKNVFNVSIKDIPLTIKFTSI